jgi:hypothetical protein
MFNLNEAFKEGYQAYLREEAEKNFTDAFEALEESQREAEKSFQVVQEYFQMYAMSEGLLTEDVTNNAPTTREKKEVEKEIASDLTLTGNLDSIKNLIGMIGKDTSASMYKPEVGNVTLTKITDMKFPNNIIFFLQALINWLSNIVKKFIASFTTGIQRLFGVSVAEDYKGDLKLNLAKVKNIESFSTPIEMDKKNLPKPISVVNMDLRDIEGFKNLFSTNILKDSFEIKIDGEIISEKTEFGSETKETVKGIMIDVSKEMQELEQTLDHFLNLFDNAYGSNQEHLFETEDLELLLELFKETMSAISSGKVPVYALQGKLTEIDVINKSKLKDNLIRTKINIDNLKRAYIETQKTAIEKLQVITQKQLFAAEGLGQMFKFYSAATYTRMINIIDVIEPRIKNANKLEKKLKYMGDKFNKVVIELGKQRRSISNFGDMTYTPVYQRKINDLFEASRYVSQTITLRLTALGIYIRELKDVQEALFNANSINSRIKKFLKKKAFGRF